MMSGPTLDSVDCCSLDLTNGFAGWAVINKPAIEDVVLDQPLASMQPAMHARLWYQPAMHAMLATHASIHPCIDLLACMRAGRHASLHAWLLRSLPHRCFPAARFGRSAGSRQHARRRARSIQPCHFTRRVTHARMRACSIKLLPRFARSHRFTH
jgi:hypothetical protein